MTIDYAVNIMSVYRRVPWDIRASDWYADANALALELSPNDVMRGAGVISALSPRKRWPQNVILARNAFATGIATGNMPMHNAKAQRILDGEYTLDVMGKTSPKTRSFAIAIATAGNGEIATIDCHAHDIAIGRVCTEKERNINTGTYNAMASAYREVAEYTGNSVNAVQAWTWEWWRIEKEIK